MENKEAVAKNMTNGTYTIYEQKKGICDDEAVLGTVLWYWRVGGVCFSLGRGRSCRGSSLLYTVLYTLLYAVLC